MYQSSHIDGPGQSKAGAEVSYVYQTAVFSPFVIGTFPASHANGQGQSYAGTSADKLPVFQDVKPFLVDCELVSGAGELGLGEGAASQYSEKSLAPVWSICANQPADCFGCAGFRRCDLSFEAQSLAASRKTRTSGVPCPKSRQRARRRRAYRGPTRPSCRTRRRTSRRA